VVHGEHGTRAPAADPRSPARPASQVRRISRARATGVPQNEDKPWEERDHALFVAFAPYRTPRYAIAVVVEHGGSGSKAAAPIARDIMAKALELDPARTPATATLERPAAQPGP
jgi:penicillin-binding protein 2